MLRWSYALCLLLSLGGLFILDWRYHLAFFRDKKRTLLTVISSVGVFVVWDLLGIGLRIFFDGTSPYTLGVFLAPNLPVEELLFLTLLCYVTLLVYKGVDNGHLHLSRPKR